MSLNLQDLEMVVRLIDICSKRGAFEGSELQSVGVLRNKIYDLVKANTPKKEETNTSEESSE